MIWQPSWTPSCIYGKEWLNSESYGFIQFLLGLNPGVGTRIIMIAHILSGLNSETKAFIEFLGPQNPGVGTRIIMISHIACELYPIQ